MLQLFPENSFSYLLSFYFLKKVSLSKNNFCSILHNLTPLIISRASLVAQSGKNLPAMQETRV